MIVSYEEALEVYRTFDIEKNAPSLHPYYIVTDAMRDESLEPKFFVYRKGEDTYYHGFHMGKVQHTGLFDIQSPYGYGGPISTTESEAFLLQAHKAYTKWALEHSILAEFIRFHPLLHNWKYYYGANFKDRDTVWIDLTVEDILGSFKTRARTAVRKAIKNGLVAEISTIEHDISIFVNMYQETMASLDASEFYFFSEKYYERMLRWDQCLVINCTYNNEIVASALFLCDGQQMEYHLSGSNVKGKEFGATNLILYEAALYGQNHGFNKLHLGGGTNSHEDNPLLFFKSGFSNSRAAFKIGKHIHNVTEYQMMKSAWISENGNTNRVLFYR